MNKEHIKMSALDYLKEKNRMTKRCSILCNDCPLWFFNNGVKTSCKFIEYDHPEQAIEIVWRYSKEHQPKTRMQDFFEKHPDATRNSDKGVPIVCAAHLGYTRECIREGGAPMCKYCWSQPLKEE